VLALGAIGTVYAFAAGILTPSWRGAAGALAVVLPLAAMTRLMFSRRLAVAVLLLQLLLVPEIALLAFAAGAGEWPRSRSWIPIAVFVAVCELVFFAVAFMNLRLRSNLTTATLTLVDRFDHRALLATTLMVLALSGILLVFDPWFAVLNLVANAAWVGVWIPRRWRTIEYEQSVVEINAPPHRVFAFATDPANWPQCRSDVEVVSVVPPGPLATGTRYTLRRRLGTVRAGRQLELVTGYVVTDLVPAKRYAVMTVERPLELGVVEFDGTGSGTRITLHFHGVTRLAQAVSGTRFTIARDLAARHAVDAERYARLKELVEGAIDPA